MKAKVERIVAGGQTGVDRAALDVALELDIPCGGWCPKGRRAEDGAVPEVYPLAETPSADYAERTRLNVRDSCATLILLSTAADAGTRLALACARELARPHLVVDLAQTTDPRPVLGWLADRGVRVLNVAGPRETSAPGIYAAASGFLRELFRAIRFADDLDERAGPQALARRKPVQDLEP